MTLVLEVEYLSGVAYAATVESRDVADWPPQPDRVFSALVASWAHRGEVEGEARALEWLEQLDPPVLLASEASTRTPVTAFVPPNDPRSDKKTAAVEVMPEKRRRQARRFPASIPHTPMVRFIWKDSEVAQSLLPALQDIARDVAYVGHSASLTRCRFVDVAAGELDLEVGSAPRFRTTRGRLAELRRTFARGERPTARTPVLPSARQTGATASSSMFSDNWLLLEHAGGAMPDLRAAAIVSRTIRDTLMSGYKAKELGDRIPEVISGHAPDGKPSGNPHVCILPLPFTGFPYADGHVMGFGVVPPKGSSLLSDETFIGVVRSLASRTDSGSAEIVVQIGQNSALGKPFSVRLAPRIQAGPTRSLDPQLYVSPSTEFATVTPIVLDRFLKAKGAAREQEIYDIIAQACRNIGLPSPERVIADKHSAWEGAPSAYTSGNAPAWQQWRLPEFLRSRQLTHAYIRFAEPVRGPVILGAGRFVGLGLCRPMHRGGSPNA